MTREEKMEVAAFRLGLISEFVGGAMLSYGEQERLIREKCSRRWRIPHSSRTRATRSTLLRWIRLYRGSNGRLESLFPRGRSDHGKTRAIDEDTALSLIRLRREMPRLPISMLIREMERRGLAPRALYPSSVYRLLHRHELMEKNPQGREDRRKFEAELPNELWQSDMMHGPVVLCNDKMRKIYLIAFLDDHSRLIPHGAFYPSEGLSSYLQALAQALVRRGLPRKLYVDNGPAFRSNHLLHISASLGISLIHSRPYKPEGRGKVERFFRTVRTEFLSGFKGETLEEINEAFDLWLDQVYHRRAHKSTGKSPLERFTSRMECIRSAPADLRDHFRKTARRRVAKDRTIILEGRLYEAPVPLIGKQVLCLYHPEEPLEVEITHQDKSYGQALPVNLQVNCRVRRSKDLTVELLSQSPSSIRGGVLWDRT